MTSGRGQGGNNEGDKAAGAPAPAPGPDGGGVELAAATDALQGPVFDLSGRYCSGRNCQVRPLAPP